MVDISDNTKWSQTDASNNTTSPTGWTTGTMLPSQVEPTARMMMGAIKRFYDHVSATVTSGGAANVQTLTYSIAPAAYVTGDFYLFKAGFSNTAGTTLNVNALGAKTVQRAGAALALNDIISGYYYGVVYDGTNFQLVVITQPPAATAQASPANPAATASLTTLVMMGLGASCTITPKRSGKVVFEIYGAVLNSVVSDGTYYQLYYGTGAAPANGAALAGTAVGPLQLVVTGTGGSGIPTKMGGIVTGLAVGTAYWFDAALATFAGGAAQISNVGGSAWEL